MDNGTVTEATNSIYIVIYFVGFVVSASVTAFSFVWVDFIEEGQFFYNFIFSLAVSFFWPIVLPSMIVLYLPHRLAFYFKDRQGEKK